MLNTSVDIVPGLVIGFLALALLYVIIFKPVWLLGKRIEYIVDWDVLLDVWDEEAQEQAEELFDKEPLLCDCCGTPMPREMPPVNDWWYVSNYQLFSATACCIDHLHTILDTEELIRTKEDSHATPA